MATPSIGGAGEAVIAGEARHGDIEGRSASAIAEENEVLGFEERRHPRFKNKEAETNAGTEAEEAQQQDEALSQEVRASSQEEQDDEDEASHHHRSFFRMRPADDDEPEDWWFASTAIPLLAATIGPLANVLSIASIVSTWRVKYDPDYPMVQDAALGIPDPAWQVDINAVSLACGFVGNLFLLFNFTRAVRYIIALPVTICLWYLATGLLTGVLAGMVVHDSPNSDGTELWGSAFWYAVIAASLYMVAAMLLMVNMLGYFLGHYTQHFELTDEQRNLILQTMMFFTWLAAGGGVFAKICGWSYSDALYFCDVTILTVGFGDFAAPNDVGRGLVFPYSVGGIIMLGLVITSISKFASQIGHSKIVHKRIELRRSRTLERTVTSSFEARERFAALKQQSHGRRPEISAPFDLHQRTIAFDADPEKGDPSRESRILTPQNNRIKRTMTMLSTINEGRKSKPVLRKLTARKPKILILREERDRFNQMRRIQSDTQRFKRYYALSMSIIAFGILWCLGAVVFWQAEQDTQQLTYFEGLYFCYVSLLTIGYGDLSPKSNAGKPFFVVWSLVAVPTMTILISDLSDTIIAAYKRGTFTLADWSIMPKKSLFAEFLNRHGRVKQVFEQYQINKRIKQGFGLGPDPATLEAPTTIEDIAKEVLDEHDMAVRLAQAIRKTADDMKAGSDRRYSYEEWVEFTRLIRFTKYDGVDGGGAQQSEEASQGLIEWDWIGKNSPMMADQNECEWVLDRLMESLDRYMHKMVPQHVKERRKSQAERRRSLMEGRRSQIGSRRSSRQYEQQPPPPPLLLPSARRGSVLSDMSETRRPNLASSESEADGGIDAGASIRSRRKRRRRRRGSEPVSPTLRLQSQQR